MKLFRICGLVVLSALMSACATGPKFATVKESIPELQADQGRIYFYRSGSMFGAAIQPVIKLNGDVVGTSKPGGFFFVDQKPGNMEVATTTEVEKKLTFVLDAGQTRYVRTAVTLGVLAGRVLPELVDDSEGEKEIVESSYTGQPLSAVTPVTP